MHLYPAQFWWCCHKENSTNTLKVLILTSIYLLNSVSKRISSGSLTMLSSLYFCWITFLLDWRRWSDGHDVRFRKKSVGEKLLTDKRHKRETTAGSDGSLLTSDDTEGAVSMTAAVAWNGHKKVKWASWCLDVFFWNTSSVWSTLIWRCLETSCSPSPVFFLLFCSFIWSNSPRLLHDHDLFQKKFPAPFQFIWTDDSCHWLRWKRS